MRVGDLATKNVISVSEETPLKEVGRLIFSLGITGVPVVKGRKLMGLVTEKDILSKMYPTLGELVEDYVHVKNFEDMERELLDLLEKPVKEIMNSSVTSVTVNTPLMEAQAFMLLRKFSRLPVVDKDNNLVGIISQGDIFRQLLRDQIPRLERERYAGFIANYYDLVVDWRKRFSFEFPTLFKLFEDKNIKSVLDIGTWTGEYTIGLAKQGVNKILGLDHNHIMIRISEDKRQKLATDIRGKVDFKLTDFTNLSKEIKGKYDAAICMGNSLPYIPVPPEKLFKEVDLVLREKNALLILQLLNFEKIIKSQKRLLYFIIQKSEKDDEKEHLIIEFFDKDKKNKLLHNVIIFDSDGINWIYKGITTVPIYYFNKNDIEKSLKKAGFNNISFSGNSGEYQGEYGKLSLTESFDPLKSDWLNVVALR